MIGIINTDDALYRARAADLDLVEFSPDADVPVCKIINYSKYRYEEQKRFKEMKKKQKRVDIKEVKLSPRIAKNDYDIKLRRARQFIESGNKVKVSLMFRGREIAHNNVGFEVMGRFKEDMKELSNIELPPKMEGRQIVMILSPL